MSLELSKEVIEEISKAAADQVVNAQAPSRKEEHNNVATRIIKFVLFITVLELSGEAFVASNLYSSLSERIACNGAATDHLQFEHIGKDNLICQVKKNCKYTH